LSKAHLSAEHTYKFRASQSQGQKEKNKKAIEQAIFSKNKIL
jgi:hypothetical protein